MKTVATIKPLCYLLTGISYKTACETCNWIYTYNKIKKKDELHLLVSYKAKFNISPALVNKQLADLKSHKTVKKASYKDVLEDSGETYVGRLLRKRGTL